MIFKNVEGKPMMMLQWWLVCILVFRNVSRKLIKKHNLSLVQITRRIWRVFMRLLLMWIPFFGCVERLLEFFLHQPITGKFWLQWLVKRITETRWSARGEAVSVVKKRFSKILCALEKLAGEDENTATRVDAGVLLVALQSFSFLCFLGLWLPILSKINSTQTYLQTKWFSLQKCDVKLRALNTFLAENRTKLVSNNCNDVG